MSMALPTFPGSLLRSWFIGLGASVTFWSARCARGQAAMTSCRCGSCVLCAVCSGALCFQRSRVSSPTHTALEEERQKLLKLTHAFSTRLELLDTARSIPAASKKKGQAQPLSATIAQVTQFCGLAIVAFHARSASKSSGHGGGAQRQKRALGLGTVVASLALLF